MQDTIIEFEGHVCRILSKGAQRNGKTFCHLASTTCWVEQGNGTRPFQMADWIDDECIAQAEADISRTVERQR
jgi:hypothetical protein